MTNVEAEDILVNGPSADPGHQAPDPSSGGEVKVEADLNILDLASILQALGANRRTGTLKAARPSGEAMFVYFKEGTLRLVNPVSAGLDILEEAMSKYRKLTREDLAEARETARSSGQSMMQVLTAQERLEEREIERMLVSLVVERTTDALAWSDVRCEFFPERILEPELDPELAEFSRGVVVDGVLLEAARRADEWERIQQTFDPVREVFELVREVPEHLSDPAERELAALVDGYRDVSEIVEASGLTSFEARKTLVEMVNNGYIQARRAGQLIQLGGTASAKGDWAKALKLYLRAQAMDRTRSDLPVRIAAAHEALGDVEQARSHLLGYVSESMAASRYMEAGRACERLVEIDPEEPEHRAKLFKCLLEIGDDDQLVTVGRELVVIYERDGVLDRAGEMLVKLRELLPDDYELAEMDARIRLATAERTEALIEYEKLADAYLARGEIGDAIRTFRKILDEIDEECLEARLQLAECLIQVERTDEAVAEYSKLADILSRTGVFSDAVNLPFVLKIHRRVAELDPENTSSHEWLAETYAARGDRDEALVEFDKLLVIYEEAENREKVVASLSRLADLYPDILGYRERLAKCYLAEQGGGEKAKAELQGLCRAAWQQEDFETGARVAERLLELDPFHMEAHVLLGEGLLARGEKEAATEKMLSAALMYMGAGLLAEAEEVFKEVLGVAGDSVDAHRFLAAILEARNSPLAAAKHYKRAGLLSLERTDFGMARTYLEFGLELNPDDAESTEALDQLRQQFGDD